jgi:hypothetical protein
MKMKNLFILTALLLQGAFLSAQDTTIVQGPWSSKGMISLNFSQVSLKNWSQGGDNSYAINTLSAFSLNYNRDKSSWSNSIDAGYGIQKVGEKPSGKTDDHLEIDSRYGYKTSGNWFVSGILNLKTQFTKGYKISETDKTLISDFMSPGYIQFSLGMEYKPSEHFFILLSPLGSKVTIVANDSLSAAGSFGVDPGKSMRTEFGGSVKAGVNVELMKNVTLTSSADFFSNYLNNPQNIDINWKMLINMKINEFLSANISTTMLYDDDIKYIDAEGNILGPRVQFKELFGIGFSVKF